MSNKNKNTMNIDFEYEDEEKVPKKGGKAGHVIPAVCIFALLVFLSFMFVPGILKKVSAAPVLTILTPTPAPSVTSQQAAIPTAKPAAQPTPVPSPSPAEDPNTKYFSASETVNINPDKTEWTYSSPDLYIDIHKYDNNDLMLHYFVADIRTRGDAMFKSGFSDETNPGSNALLPEYVARKLHAVLLMNGDFFEDPRNPNGVIIRHGVVYKDDKKADTLAIMPDGTLKVYSAGGINADGLLKLGVKDTFSFGPYLINNGVINPDLSKATLERANPRTGIGMIEKGHYVAIVVEGRNPKDNRGVTLSDYAKMFSDLGCTVAYNLDGGASSAMVFMGNTLNIPTDILTTKTWRRVPDTILIGTSDSIPAYK